MPTLWVGAAPARSRQLATNAGAFDYRVDSLHPRERSAHHDDRATRARHRQHDPRWGHSTDRYGFDSRYGLGVVAEWLCIRLQSEMEVSSILTYALRLSIDST